MAASQVPDLLTSLISATQWRPHCFLFLPQSVKKYWIYFPCFDSNYFPPLNIGSLVELFSCSSQVKSVDIRCVCVKAVQPKRDLWCSNPPFRHEKKKGAEKPHSLNYTSPHGHQQHLTRPTLHHIATVVASETQWYFLKSRMHSQSRCSWGNWTNCDSTSGCIKDVELRSKHAPVGVHIKVLFHGENGPGLPCVRASFTKKKTDKIRHHYLVFHETACVPMARNTLIPINNSGVRQGASLHQLLFMIANYVQIFYVSL